MDMEAGPFYQPVLNQLGFVGSVVVHDEVDVQFFGHVLLDGVKKVPELFGTMALLILADDFAGLGIQRSKQAGRAVPRIVVGAAFDLPLPTLIT